MVDVDTIVSGTWDLIVSILLLFIFFYSASHIRQKKMLKYDYYKRYSQVVVVKLFAGILFAFIYIFVFKGGDTIYYFNGSRSIVHLAAKDLWASIEITLGKRTPELYSLFDYRTWWPTYYKDPNAWAVCRFMTIFYILGMGSYWGATIVMNAVLFIPIWNFYKMLVRMYPKQHKNMAVALFYLPSLVFWSSGILKDIWCYVAILQLYVCAYRIFYRKHRIFVNVLNFLFWSYIVISIRPFMFYTGFITVMLWIGLRWLRGIENGFIRQLTFPIVLIFLGGTSSLIITQLGSVAEGKYATVNSMMEHAVVIQKDLSRSEAYGENTFDIGSFDASFGSMASKAPIAITAGMFRPFLWESRSFLMMFSGLESAFLLLFLGYLLLRSKIIGFFMIIFRDPFIISCLVFALLFGFFVGLTSANFGALVRYKIALLPFFTIVLYRVYGVLNEQADE